MRGRALLLVAIGCALGAGGHWLIGRLRVSWVACEACPRLATAGAPAPEPRPWLATVVGDRVAAIPTVGGPAVRPKYLLDGPARRLTFTRCPLEFVRDAGGRFTEHGRFHAPRRVLRPGRTKVVVVEEWFCEPCKRTIEQLTAADLGAGVDLVVLGIGDQYGNHADALHAIAGHGWLYVGGFDEEALLDGVFGADSVATPSILILDEHDVIVRAAQGLPAGESVGWVRDQLAALHIAGTSDQPLASPDGDHDDDVECAPPPPPPSVDAGVGDAANVADGLLDPFARPDHPERPIEKRVQRAMQLKHDHRKPVHR